MKNKPLHHALVTTCALADIGHHRSQQEDSLGYVNIPPKQKTDAYKRGHLYVVADGIGGSRGGEIASSLAVETILKTYYTASSATVELALKKAILRANEEILAESIKYNLPDMGTTVVCVVLCDETLYITHLGDSRAYLLREGRLKRLSTDHSYIQELIQKGELTEQEGRTHSQYHKITHALGISSSIELDIRKYQIAPSDQILLCSDGLHDQLDDHTIKKLLLAQADQQTSCTAFVQQANLAGGRDNVSLIITRVDALQPISEAKTYTTLPSLRMRQLNKWRYTRLALANPSLLQSIKALSWPGWQSSWFLGLTTVILAALLIVQTIWVQDTLQTTDEQLHRAQEEIELIIESINNEGYGHVDERLIQDLIKAQPKPSQPLNTPTPFVINP